MKTGKIIIGVVSLVALGIITTTVVKPLSFTSRESENKLETSSQSNMNFTIKHLIEFYSESPDGIHPNPYTWNDFLEMYDGCDDDSPILALPDGGFSTGTSDYKGDGSIKISDKEGNPNVVGNMITDPKATTFGEAKQALRKYVFKNE
ncbi:hypothetical protein [Lactococcus formosensis]|jgi:hypothetical protein|uniref:Uncharacterized protein n=1 Tax=Lactococcus formosensis TaxID=1281486 RepID=A0A9Q8Y4Y8_9LACT|nr:hypothetical protein [Lactococcus formosensis]USJ21575.1 hypothetical protein LMK00_11670 [Lactococcus formosensis]